MNDLIKLTPQTIGGEIQQTVNARDLHSFLEVGKDFSTWIKDRIEKYGFVEDVDYVKIDSPKVENLCGEEFSPNLVKNTSRGRPSIEYYISLSMGKELGMVERSDKGREIRRYFIRCEKELKDIKQTSPALPDFTNPAVAARAWAEQFEKRQALEKQLLLEAPKVQAAEDFLKSDGDHIIRKVAKALGVGVRFLYDWMRQKKLISKFNEPYADFVQRGYLRPVPSYHEGSDGSRKCDLTTHITNSGIFYIWKRLKNEGHIPENRQIQLELLKDAA